MRTKKALTLVEKRITTVIYARVSTDDQGDGASLESQLLRCRARAQELGAEVIQEFIDCGVSAFQGARQNWEASIALACSQHCSYYICWDSSRFARDHVVAGMATRRLFAAGVMLDYGPFSRLVRAPRRR